MWLDITVHNAIRMAVIQSLEKLKDVKPNIEIGQGGIKNLKICIVHVFKDQTGCLGLRIPDHVEELNNVGSTAHVLLLDKIDI